MLVMLRTLPNWIALYEGARVLAIVRGADVPTWVWEALPDAFVGRGNASTPRASTPEDVLGVVLFFVAHGGGLYTGADRMAPAFAAISPEWWRRRWN